MQYDTNRSTCVPKFIPGVQRLGTKFITEEQTGKTFSEHDVTADVF